MPKKRSIEVVVHLPPAEAASAAAEQLGGAFASYFGYRADRLDLDRRELFRIGRWSLLIGMATLASCMVLSRSLAGLFGEGYFKQFFQEGLIVLG